MLDAHRGKVMQLRKFLDLPLLEKRLAELEAQMATDSFWGNPEAARKVIDESNGLKRKAEPMAAFGRRLDDVQVLLELGEAEPPSGQDAVQRGIRAKLAIVTLASAFVKNYVECADKVNSAKMVSSSPKCVGVNIVKD